MELEVDIRTYLKSTLDSGFKIAESKDFGMAKFCRLEYPILGLEIWNDRSDYDAIIEFNQRKYNLIHLVSFLKQRKGTKIFLDFNFENGEINAKKFLTQLDELMKYNLDDILNFFFNLTDEEQSDFDKYCLKRNRDLLGSK